MTVLAHEPGEDEFEHGHVAIVAAPSGARLSDEEVLAALAERIWSLDNVELTTVGIDVGSSTSHFMFARLHLRRLTTAVTTRFEVVERTVLWQSPILLTPYKDNDTIDAQRLALFFAQGYALAGVDPAAIDAGAVILTGEALKRRNARAIADLFANQAGKFVCASAGHHLESVMGAHGSGAVRLSQRTGKTILNLDVGGGTAKFALIRNGTLLGTAAIAVGARLVVTDAQNRVVRLERPLVEIAADLGIDVQLGEPLEAADRGRIVRRMAELLRAMIERRPADALAARLLLTEWWQGEASTAPIDVVTLSGGVAEYFYERETKVYADLGWDLAHEISHQLAQSGGFEVWDPGVGIRATVSGAAQFTVQVSGNTVQITDPQLLPLRNVPALVCRFPLDDEVDADAIAAVVRETLEQHDREDGDGALALSFAWEGLPTYPRLVAVARGIASALPRTVANAVPLVLTIDGDVGMTLGRILEREVAPGSYVVALDGIALNDFDYVDIGELIPITDVVPVVIKSLLF